MKRNIQTLKEYALIYQIWCPYNSAWPFFTIIIIVAVFSCHQRWFTEMCTTLYNSPHIYRRALQI